ncbi:MAG: MoxR family ATPase [Lachnospiraceae bacterium]|nr:MoxR family ATPase [Lachnospiraceae bacterium]
MTQNNTTNQVVDEIKKVIHGKDEIIKAVLATILAGGHVLLEDIPGVGKTTLAVSFSKAMSLTYRRVQFTPDVLPSDIVGFKLFDRESGEFRFEEGSIYTNLFLADEINRTSPKTQSALLEVMEERQVTVEGEMRKVPEPFFVIATQNPFGSSGTQRLPESQLDRFMTCLTMGYPAHADAIDVLKGDSHTDIKNVNAIVNADTLLLMQKEVANLHVDESIYDYIVTITEETRNDSHYSLGLSPRGSIALLQMSKANAYLNGRDYVIPEDIEDIFLPVSKHRVKLTTQSIAAGDDLEMTLLNTLHNIPQPKVN